MGSREEQALRGPAPSFVHALNCARLVLQIFVNDRKKKIKEERDRCFDTTRKYPLRRYAPAYYKLRKNRDSDDKIRYIGGKKKQVARYVRYVARTR